MIISRHISRIMKQEGLVSTYITAQFHPQKTPAMSLKQQML